MIIREHALPIARQAEALNISRGSVYYLPRPVSATDLELMRRLDRLHLEFPNGQKIETPDDGGLSSAAPCT